MPRSPGEPEPERRPDRTTRVHDARTTTVHAQRGDLPFGELTLEDVRRQASELGSVGSWGPLRRVVPVARSWSELARELESKGVTSVGELDDATLLAYAERLWVVPPAGGLI